MAGPRAWVWWGMWAALALSGCASRPSPPSPPPAASTKSRPPFEFKGSGAGHLTLTDEKGEPLCEMAGEQMEWDDQTKTGEMKRARCTFYDKGMPASRFRADTITVLSPDTGMKVLLKGQVEAQLEKGLWTLRAPAVTWIYQREGRQAEGGGKQRFPKSQVFAEQGVVLGSGSVTIKAGGLVADAALRQVHLTGGVRGSVRPVSTPPRSGKP